MNYEEMWAEIKRCRDENGYAYATYRVTFDDVHRLIDKIEMRFYLKKDAKND